MKLKKCKQCNNYSLKENCPKCKEIPMTYNEIWVDHAISFDVSTDGTISNEGQCTFYGNPSHVIAHCICAHEWRLKGVCCIDDLTNKYRNQDKGSR